MNQANPLKLVTPAKVNLALSVGVPDSHSGLHPIASWMVAFDFTDVLTLSKLTDGPSRFDIAFVTGVTADHTIDTAPVPWAVNTDLTYRAHQLLQEHTGRELPVDLQLLKRIPAGAGLGGGSGNAAYALVGIARLYNLDLSRGELTTLAASLGSDVPFFIGAALGEPSAIVTGTGEQVDPAPLAAPIDLVLCFPDTSCPTGEVYATFDRLIADHNPPPQADTQRVRNLASAATSRLEIDVNGLNPIPVFNDLAEAAKQVRPSLQRVADDIYQATGAVAHVSGSGSTLYLIGTSRGECEQWARTICERVGIAATAARSLETGMSLVDV